MSSHQWTLPSLSQKWLRHPLVLQTEGCNVGRPSRLTSMRHLGSCGACVGNETTSPHPQGHLKSAQYGRPLCTTLTNCPGRTVSFEGLFSTTTVRSKNMSAGGALEEFRSAGVFGLRRPRMTSSSHRRSLSSQNHMRINTACLVTAC